MCGRPMDLLSRHVTIVHTCDLGDYVYLENLILSLRLSDLSVRRDSSLIIRKHMTILNILNFGEINTPKYEALHPGLVIFENLQTFE
jgi:hypothetical protein